jgi:hypothetical protein
MVLVAMLVFTVMMLGLYFVTTGEQKIAASDRDNAVAYYGAMGALEKMSSDLAAFFVSHTSPTPAQINALTGPTYRPSVPGVTFPSGGYTIGFTTVGGTLASTVGTIAGNGPLQGLQGIITPFTLTVIADGPNSTEVKMTRVVQEVAVPVFQFGIFSDSDLSFFAGPDFGFGGRIHSNGNLFLAEDGGILTVGDRTTAYKDIIRKQLSNGFAVGSGNYDTTVNVLKTAGGCPGTTTTCRALALTEGSVTGGPGSSANTNWPTLSLTTYNGWIRNGKTGAKKLNLALALAGGTPIAMIQRPVTVPPGPYEDPTSTIGSARFFSQASLRILLSDTAAAIAGLPGVTPTAPLPLDASLNTGSPATLPTNSCHPPVALSPGYPADHDYMSPINTTLLGGYIKIEIQLNSLPGTWQDVTQEILSLGISRDVQSSGTGSCPASSQISILHLEEKGLRVTLDSTTKTTTATNFVPINLYDPREGEVRDSNSYSTVALNGVMNIVEVNVGNLQKWFANALCTASTVPTSCPSGALALKDVGPGYILYFSDRRGNQDASGNETAEYGNEDTITPSSATGAPNGVLDAAEDVNANGILDTYSATPHPIAVDSSTGSPWPAFMSSMPATNPAFKRISSVAIWMGAPVLGSPTSGGSLLAITPYYYTVTALGAWGETAIDLAAGGTESSKATTATNKTIPVSWTAYTGATGYNVYRGTSPGGETGYYSMGSASTSKTDTGGTGFTTGSLPLGPVAQKNSVVIFRRALRLVNGTLGNLPPRDAATAANCTTKPAGGFTVAAENPVYVLGDYNASVAHSFNDATNLCHVPAAVMGDAVTLLSNAWVDSTTFNYPTSRSSRPSTTETWYRMAIIGGKNNSFTRPTFSPTPPQDFGTDGGTHNFLRYIENWSTPLNYLGSMCSFYIARQATGVYKCCSTVYNPPTRNYKFDTDFQNIGKLPPGTPRFTDVNALSFQQAILSTQ